LTASLKIKRIHLVGCMEMNGFTDMNETHVVQNMKTCTKRFIKFDYSQSYHMLLSESMSNRAATVLDYGSNAFSH
jgi:hypothetical protein